MSESAAAAQEQMPIKEEIVDDYNTTNIFCKKVRKAQQTKGFWINSPNSSASSNMAVPIITTTASTPPPPSSPVGGSTTVIATSSTSMGASTATTAALAPPPTAEGTHYLMGPPAQIGASTSPHSLDVSNTATSINATPKVSSRNMQSLLRAKKYAAAAAAAAIAAANDGTATDISVDKDADLPENLGLPRERVISICNMDKHELDDYFLPEEEENSQDQDTELLQYFQTGDAEEKLNSLDAVKLRNPTATTAATITQTPATERKSLSTQSSRQFVASESGGGGIRMQHINSNNSGFATIDISNAATAALTNKTVIATTRTTTTTTTTTTNSTISATTTAKTTAAAVGSASASLALMSQKHQQQQIQQHQQQHLNNNNKRKINHADMIQARKNCSFLPISPNINTSNSVSHVAAVAVNANQHNSNTGGFFASPGQQSTTRIRPKPSILMNKQQSLDCDSSNPMIGEIRRRRSYIASNITTSPSAPPSPSMLQQQQLDSSSNDPMIGASRRRRSYVTFMGNTSASAPPSPSVLQQQQHQQQMYGSVGQHFHNNSWQLSSNNAATAAAASAYNDMSNADLLNEQNSIDLDLFAAAAAATNANSAAFTQHHTLTLDAAGTATGADDFLLAPLNETQRSQSVPLSQLQRIHSPTFNRVYQSANYSACPSVVQTPIPHDFGDSTLCSENSNSQHSIGGHAAGAAAGGMKLEDSGVLASDSTAILDEVDVTEILSSPDFVAKFSSIAQANTATTTCSSAGSSSGYSSGACTSFGTSVMSAIGCGGGPSRSVPSTPLPHHQYQHTFGSFYSRRRTAAGSGNDEMHLSPTTATAGGISSAIGFTSSFKYGNGNAVDRHSYGGGGMCGTRSAYDISKSMPTTPITTPGFRFSPTEFSRDFLINGNTIDCITSFGPVGGNGGAGDTLDASDSLINDGVITGDNESIMVGSDILGNL